MPIPTPEQNIEERVIGGQYRIIKALGAGGMGAIYYGVHILTEQPVAIKMLHSSLLGDEVIRQRFLSEASVLARMEHPHIVQWKNYIEEESGLYLIMQFVEGDNVENRLEKHDKVPLEDAISFTIQTLAGLDYVHSKGVIHRDLKPANILLTKDNQVKLADFGIARLTGTNRFTKAGMTIGTFFYMAPEQILGHDSDHRADIYSMGITMFEMVTGRMPFQGETEFDVCKQHLESPLPSIRKYTSGLPKKLDAILTKATAKRADERFQSAQEFITALEINFPEIAGRVNTSGVHSTSLGKKEVTKLLEEYNNKPKRGCMKSFLWLLFLGGLLFGLGYIYFYCIDAEENIPVKHGKVEVHLTPRRTSPKPRNTFLQPTAQRAYLAQFEKNLAKWPIGTHLGAIITTNKQGYKVQTPKDGTKPLTICPTLLNATQAPISIRLGVTALQSTQDKHAIFGVTLAFGKEKGKNQGYYIAFDPPRQRVRIVALVQGKEKEMMPWKQHKALLSSGRNQIQVILQDDTFQVLINKTELPPVSDQTYKKGQICLFVQPGGSAFLFHSFRVAKK